MGSSLSHSHIMMWLLDVSDMSTQRDETELLNHLISLLVMRSEGRSQCNSVRIFNHPK